MDEQRKDMSFPQYTVSDAAALTGMHPQTIRFFDRSGIVTPARDSRGQRLYSYYDILNLLRRNQLKDLGFSVQETEQLFTGAMAGDLPSILREKSRELAQQERALSVARHNLDRMRGQLERASLCEGRILFRERPASWHVPYSRGGRICFDESGSGILSVAESCTYAFAFQDAASRQWDDFCDWDMVMEPEDAEAVGFTALPGSFFVPGQLCLYTVFRVTGTDFLTRENMRLLYDYTDSCGLVPEGAIHGCPVLQNFSEGTVRRSYEVWMPVTDPKRPKV